ncbi:unnamed protein product, partial [Rotaria magnacalcarata]
MATSGRKGLNENFILDRAANGYDNFGLLGN